MANRGEQSETATTEIIIGCIAGGIVLLCLLYVIGMEIGERLCRAGAAGDETAPDHTCVEGREDT